MPSIADAGYLIAYWSDNDVHHDWARALDVKTPIITCDAVVTEAAYITGATELLLEMILDGDLEVRFDITEYGRDILRWLEKYHDLAPGYADACVVKLGEIYPSYDILTTDARHFRAYRTLSGKPLRCRFPD